MELYRSQHCQRLRKDGPMDANSWLKIYMETEWGFRTRVSDFLEEYHQIAWYDVEDACDDNGHLNYCTEIYASIWKTSAGPRCSLSSPGSEPEVFSFTLIILFFTDRKYSG